MKPATLTSPCLVITHREFFGQGWMKLEKNERTPYIMKTTKHFNDVSTGWAAPPCVAADRVGHGRVARG